MQHQQQQKREGYFFKFGVKCWQNKNAEKLICWKLLVVPTKPTYLMMPPKPTLEREKVQGQPASQN